MRRRENLNEQRLEMARTDTSVFTYPSQAFAVISGKEQDVALIKQAWMFNTPAACERAKNRSYQYDIITKLANSPTREIPPHTLLTSLVNKDEKSLPESLELGTQVGFYSAPLLNMQHIFDYSLLSLTSNASNSTPSQIFHMVELPELLSSKHLRWLNMLGHPQNAKELPLTPSEFLYLRQSGLIGNHPYFKNNNIEFYSPLSKNLPELFGVDVISNDDEENISSINRIHVHRKSTAVDALIHTLINEHSSDEMNSSSEQAMASRYLRSLESKANLTLITKHEQFRVFACLQHALQNIFIDKPVKAVYRGLSQVYGLQPYFYLSMDIGGFQVAERLQRLGITPHPKIMPLFQKTLSVLKQDGLIPNNHDTALHHGVGVLSDLVSKTRNYSDKLIDVLN